MTQQAEKSFYRRRKSKIFPRAIPAAYWRSSGLSGPCCCYFRRRDWRQILQEKRESGNVGPRAAPFWEKVETTVKGNSVSANNQVQRGWGWLSGGESQKLVIALPAEKKSNFFEKTLQFASICAIICLYAVLPLKTRVVLCILLCTNIRDFKEEPNNGSDSGFHE